MTKEEIEQSVHTLRALTGEGLFVAEINDGLSVAEITDYLEGRAARPATWELASAYPDEAEPAKPSEGSRVHDEYTCVLRKVLAL